MRKELGTHSSTKVRRILQEGAHTTFVNTSCGVLWQITHRSTGLDASALSCLAGSGFSDRFRNVGFEVPVDALDDFAADFEAATLGALLTMMMQSPRECVDTRATKPAMAKNAAAHGQY